MAGAPRKRAMQLELDRRADDMDGITVLEYAIDWVAGGRTLLELTDDINRTLKLGDNYVSRHMVSSYLNGLEDGAGKAALEKARLDGGHSLADQSIQIVDEEVSSKEDVARNKLRAEHRTRMAGFMNREGYGQQFNKGVNVQVNMGQMHLDAMRRRNVTATSQPALAAPAEPDVELVTGDETAEG